MDVDHQKCIKCDKEFKEGEEIIKCTGLCNKRFHPKCIGFTPTTVKFYKECENLMYVCDQCQNGPLQSMNLTLKKLMSFMCIFNERLNRQEINSETMFKQFDLVNQNIENLAAEIKSEIAHLSNVNMNSTIIPNTTITSDTYAEVTKKRMIEPVVLVKPKKTQRCNDTRADLNSKGVSDEFQISSVNNIPKGGLEIQCNSAEEQKKVHDKVTKELGDKYQIIMPQLRKPKVRITNMSDKLTESEIIESIKEKNMQYTDSEMKVICVYEMKNMDSYGTIIEVDTKTFNAMMEQEKINIRWNVCKVLDCVNVLRCFNCCGYNHKSTSCRNKKACLRCGGEHLVKDCKSNQSKCINCKISGEKLKLKLDLNHPVWSRTCPILQKKIEIQRKQTLYKE